MYVVAFLWLAFAGVVCASHCLCGWFMLVIVFVLSCCVLCGMLCIGVIVRSYM